MVYADTNMADYLLNTIHNSINQFDVRLLLCDDFLPLVVMPTYLGYAALFEMLYLSLEVDLRMGLHGEYTHPQAGDLATVIVSTP